MLPSNDVCLRPSEDAFRQFPAMREVQERNRPLSHIEWIANRYRFPRGFSGKGECIGILSFGGGVVRKDLTRYFRHEIGAMPDMRFEYLGSQNQPNVNSRYDQEVALDIQVAGSLAPSSRIVCYFSTNDKRGWVEALTRAIHDDENKPSILSISWGAVESWWGSETIHTLNRLFGEAANRGITVCAASGDDGCARDENGHCQVTFPASSPFVLACGGTSIGPDNREVVWNVRNKSASGGGISDQLARPDWQTALPKPIGPSLPSRRNPEFSGRQLPDVAGIASHSYSVYVGGGYRNGAGGTSVVAPLWSALIARLNEGLKSRGLSAVGYFHPQLYRDLSIQKSFAEVTSGHNDSFGRNGYEANPGWNPCTGWGVPDGEKLLEALLV